MAWGEPQGPNPFQEAYDAAVAANDAVTKEIAAEAGGPLLPEQVLFGLLRPAMEEAVRSAIGEHASVSVLHLQLAAVQFHGEHVHVLFARAAS